MCVEGLLNKNEMRRKIIYKSNNSIFEKLKNFVKFQLKVPKLP